MLTHFWQQITSLHPSDNNSNNNNTTTTTNNNKQQQTTTNNNNNNKQRRPRQQQQQQTTTTTTTTTTTNNKQQQQQQTTTTTTTTTTPEHGHGLHPTHTFHGSALAGARLSGVSLINPGAGPAPVSSPEAFGGNRRLYTAAPPAADRLCPIPVHPRPTIIVVIYSVFCVWRSKNIVFYRVLWPSPSRGFISATLKNYGFFMVLGLRKGSGTENWTS